MKEHIKKIYNIIKKSSFLKYFFLMQVPAYAVILWIFILLGFRYWIAYLFANQIYVLIMYPLVKKGVFDIK